VFRIDAERTGGETDVAVVGLDGMR
jgi:hypothetical protein